MDLRNSNGFELRNSYFTTVWKLFSKIFIRSEKMHHVELNSDTQVVKNRSIRLRILTYENPMRRYIRNQVKLWELHDSILRLEISIYCLPRNFN